MNKLVMEVQIWDHEKQSAQVSCVPTGSTWKPAGCRGCWCLAPTSIHTDVTNTGLPIQEVITDNFTEITI